MISLSISSGELTGRSTSSKDGGETNCLPGMGRIGREVKKGWARISGMVIRFTGSFSSILVSRLLAGSLISSGISKTPILTFCNNDLMLSSSKGSLPVSRAKRMIPQDQISEELPW
jgi:hypothetical protein